MEKELTDISIPTSLYKQIEEKIKGSDVASVQDFVIKVLKDNLPKSEGSAEGLSKEEEDKVKERLKALGYMD
ncbi:CopG family transcriptional regulator [Acidobacteriota bacterium]